MVVRTPDEVGLIEIKTANGFSFRSKSAARSRRSGDLPPEGPADNAVRQVSLAGMALDADWVVVMYLALERNTKADGLRQVVAEWTLTRPEYTEIARNEIARVQSVAKAIEEGRLIRRHAPEMPKGAEIIEPESASWMSWNDAGEPAEAGNIWNGKYCDYCRFNTRCREDGREGAFVDLRVAG